MKINRQTDFGWTETKTENFEVKIIKACFDTVDRWVDFHTKRPEFKKNRSGATCCDRCQSNWNNKKGQYVSLAQMKGHVNKVLCESCTHKLLFCVINQSEFINKSTKVFDIQK